MITDPFLLLFVLIGGHFYFDFAGQGPFMSDAKNVTRPVPGVDWWLVLFGHATIHGTFVAAMTGNVYLGLVEVVVHYVTDLSKCRNRISFLMDQVIHLVCKLVYMEYIWLHLILHP